MNNSARCAVVCRATASVAAWSYGSRGGKGNCSWSLTLARCSRCNKTSCVRKRDNSKRSRRRMRMADKSKPIEYTEEEVARRRDALAKHMSGLLQDPLKNRFQGIPINSIRLRRPLNPLRMRHSPAKERASLLFRRARFHEVDDTLGASRPCHSSLSQRVRRPLRRVLSGCYSENRTQRDNGADALR